LAGLIVLVVILWIGLKIKSGPFAPLPVQGSELNTMTLAEDLPTPVDRFYRAVFGDRVPLIESAVISGRAKIRMFGVSLPGRFRFIHDAGVDYRHNIEVTLFGFPIMKVNEFYLDGRRHPLGSVQPR
jgi:hypothetical protein